MNQDLVNKLSIELEAFSKLESTSLAQLITDAYNRILGIVQAMMLSSDNPDTHVRAWSVLNEDAYKDLAEIQEGRTEALPELKFKINQVGEILLQSKA